MGLGFGGILSRVFKVFVVLSFVVLNKVVLISCFIIVVFGWLRRVRKDI